MKTCKSDSRAKKTQIDVGQPKLIQKYNSRMDVVDQLGKIDWMQLIHLVCHLKVAGSCFYDNLHPEKKVSHGGFLWSLGHQYIRFVRTKTKIECKPGKDSLFLEPHNQGRSK